MKIIQTRYLAGPNIFHNRPVSILKLDLESLADTSSAELPGFIERLTKLLPDLYEHHCSPGHKGGFIERLNRGTYFAHIVEHIALELSGKCGIGVTYGKSIYGGQPGIYQVIVRSKSKSGMEEILNIAVGLANSLAKNEHFDLEERLSRARRIISRTELGPSTRAIVDAAIEKNIPVLRLNDASLVQLGYGIHKTLIEAAVTSRTSSIALGIAKDKSLTKTLLSDASIPVPRGEEVSTLVNAIAAMENLGGPVAVKPVDGNHGRGVSLSITNATEMETAFAFAQNHSEYVLVEELFRGQDYRVLVVDGKMVAAALRTPACVVGDGESSILSLTERENEKPERGIGHEKPMTRIGLGPETIAFLNRNQLNLQSVPRKGERVFLSATANLSKGGTSTDGTDEVHPQIRDLCERAARVVGLDICGIDLVADDIRCPLAAKGNGIIEINAGPGLRMHLFPSVGERREVGKAILSMLYPPGAKSRIPIVAITGTNGKTTVTRLISHVFSESGLKVGTTTTGGIQIDGKTVIKGDTTGPASARTVLSDPSVEIAVLETARGGIVRRGLGYDWSDVGVVTNIQSDHIGQDGIENIDDIIRIKSLIPERVREGGTLVLNADDENVIRMMENPRLMRSDRRLVYFSLSAHNLLVRRHLSEGGRAYVLEEGYLQEIERSSQTKIAKVDEIPITVNGTAGFQIANALAAAAACRAENISFETIKKAFLSFHPADHNSGRANLFRVGKGYAMVDYGHNPAAFRAICEMAGNWRGRRVTGVLSLPGDRKDEILKESGTIIGDSFDQVYLREDRDLRGRKPGEATALIRHIIKTSSPSTNVHEIANELSAVRAAVENMIENEIIVIFYDNDPTSVTSLLREMGATSATQIPDRVIPLTAFPPVLDAVELRAGIFQ